MSNHHEQEETVQPERPSLRLDRANRKLLGVCGGFARYLEVPSALVRVIFCIACLVSPILILAYFILYWLLEDEERPGRIKAAISGLGSDSGSQRTKESGKANGNSSTPEPERRRFDFRRPLYRSRRNVWIGGVCAGLADYLGISAAIIRCLTLLSLFILGGATWWVYLVLWIVLDKEPKRRKAAPANGNEPEEEDVPDLDTCAAALKATERRLREVEAYITSKQFRLHCEINKI